MSFYRLSKTTFKSCQTWFYTILLELLSKLTVSDNSEDEKLVIDNLAFEKNESDNNKIKVCEQHYELKTYEDFESEIVVDIELFLN